MKGRLAVVAVLIMALLLSACGRDVSGTYEYGPPGSGTTITLNKDRSITYHDPAYGDTPQWSNYQISGSQITFSINPEGLVFTVQVNGDLLDKGGNTFHRLPERK